MYSVSLIASFLATSALARSLPGAHKHLHHARQDDVHMVVETVTATAVVTQYGGSEGAGASEFPDGGDSSSSSSSSSAFRPVQAQKKAGGGQGKGGATITTGPTSIPQNYPTSSSTSASAAGSTGGGGSYGGGNGGGSGTITIPSGCQNYASYFTTPAGSSYAGPDTGFSVSLSCMDGIYPTSNQNATKFTDTEDYVALHNSYRAFHSIGTLTLDSDAAASATAYAQQCLMGDPPKDASPPCPGGANWYGNFGVTHFNGQMQPTATTPAEIKYSDGIYAWYNELVGYYVQSNDFSGNPNYDQPPLPSPKFKPDDTLHFTQLVWKKTTGVGCAMKEACGGVNATLHCIYTPAGNDGSYLENVLMPVPSVMTNT